MDDVDKVAASESPQELEEGPATTAAVDDDDDDEDVAVVIAVVVLADDSLGSSARLSLFLIHTI